MDARVCVCVLEREEGEGGDGEYFQYKKKRIYKSKQIYEKKWSAGRQADRRL